MDMFGYVWGKVFAEIDIKNGLDQFERPVFLGDDGRSPYKLSFLRDLATCRRFSLGCLTVATCIQSPTYAGNSRTSA
jgi:hypothetical protein